MMAGRLNMRRFRGTNRSDARRVSPSESGLPAKRRFLNPYIFLIPLATLHGQPACCGEEVLVVVNQTNQAMEFSRNQVIDFFMGRQQNFHSGKAVFTIDLAQDSPTRAHFYQQLVGKSVPQVNAYWARLLFTGNATPPKMLPSPAAVLSAVKENADAIGYVDGRDYDGCCKVVYRLKPAD